MLIYLQHSDIDKAKWDKCIDESINGLIYAYSWYLDIVSPNWDALVEGDYEAVMPLTWRKKWGVRYIFQPMFTQQMGIFSHQPLKKELLQDFLKQAGNIFKSIEYKLNYGNNDLYIHGFEIKKNNNFILDLNHDYTAIYNKFTDSHKKNIRRSERQEIFLDHQINFSDFSLFVEKTLVNKIDNVSHKDFSILNKLLSKLSQHVEIKPYIVFSSYEKSVILSAACFIFCKGRIIFYSSSSEEGKKKKTMFYLLNDFIKDHAKSNYILDFSGSNIPSIAYFFEGFGTSHQPYFSIRLNKLPFLLKLLKKLL